MKKLFTIFSGVLFLYSYSYGLNSNNRIKNNQIQISVSNTPNSLWEYEILSSGKILNFEKPQIQIDGKLTTLTLINLTKVENFLQLRNSVKEYRFKASIKEIPDISFTLIFRIPEDNPIIKFCYELSSNKKHLLTKTAGVDDLIYFTSTLNQFSDFKEVRFSEFNEMVHSFCLSEREIVLNDLADNPKFMGPMITASNNEYSALLAYEHGSQVPDNFLEFEISANKKVMLKAVKGNYTNGYDLTNGYQTIWFETGAVKGNEDALASKYREFMLKYMTENLESRKPYIFYNTWNFQERNKHWYKKPYLADMTLERMLKEIDAAHEIGIEIFVVDAGWFEKTGDWTPSLKRFPDGLKQVKSKLSEYGMKLGLWFNPTVAAVSSNMYKTFGNCVKTMNGDKGKPRSVWETEESYGMCLVSQYRDAFADKLIQLNKELGVTYFKWDAIGQYECNDPHHYHGDSTNTPQERLENYAFEIGRSMSYVVDKLSKACPEAIVDFDITEGGRTVGLSFLSSGKYFLINNGPYYFNYNIPFDQQNDNWNIFFYPGPARGWICRFPLTYDKWIPTVLFLTHYLPDDPYENQSIAVGSLILGQNGIWGDLPAISKDGIAFLNKTLTLYKQVRDDMTSATMIRDGDVGGSPEVYEKINPVTGKGAIVIFSSHAGKYNYVSKTKVNSEHWETTGSNVNVGMDGKARVDVEFKKAEAKIIFFGAKE